MQHEFGVCVDEFDQSEQEALVASGVKFCGFLFEFKAVGHFPFEGQTLRGRDGEPESLPPPPRRPEAPSLPVPTLLPLWGAAARVCRRLG